jgi:hypothetical protein
MHGPRCVADPLWLCYLTDLTFAQPGFFSCLLQVSMPAVSFLLASKGPFVSTISSLAGFPLGSQVISLPPPSCPLAMAHQVCANPVVAPRAHPCVCPVLVTLELSLSWQQRFRHVIALWQRLGAFALACRLCLDFVLALSRQHFRRWPVHWGADSTNNTAINGSKNRARPADVGVDADIGRDSTMGVDTGRDSGAGVDAGRDSGAGMDTGRATGQSNSANHIRCK